MWIIKVFWNKNFLTLKKKSASISKAFQLQISAYGWNREPSATMVAQLRTKKYWEDVKECNFAMVSVSKGHTYCSVYHHSDHNCELLMSLLIHVTVKISPSCHKELQKYWQINSKMVAKVPSLCHPSKSNTRESISRKKNHMMFCFTCSARVKSN